MFEKLIWQNDRVLFDDLVFRLEPFPREEGWDEDYFRFYKDKITLDQYDAFWRSVEPFKIRNMLEFGIWNGGSLALWFECLQPAKLVGIDRLKRTNSQYFEKYIRSRGLSESLKTYWDTDQSDTGKILQVINAEFTSPLDLVIDDASHYYEQTKATFECVFPFLRPGGLYIIEDWAWAHWPEYQAPDHPYFGGKEELTKLVVDCVEAAGSPGQIIRRLTVFPRLAVVERGEIDETEIQHFSLNRYISRRPKLSGFKKLFAKSLRSQN